MTVACTEALAMRECLAAGSQGIARRFFQAANKLIDIPWQMAVGSDLRHPAVAGKRTAQLRFINWYLAKLFQAAQRDAVLATRFLEVANLMKPPPSLMRRASRCGCGREAARPPEGRGQPRRRPDQPSSQWSARYVLYWTDTANTWREQYMLRQHQAQRLHDE
jgi:hypothetical protein